MDNSKFIQECKHAIAGYMSHYNEDVYKDLSDFSIASDIYVVWSCKTLQNNKALLSTTLLDNMYYECTYNGDTHELYLDVYEKKHNEAINIEV